MIPYYRDWVGWGIFTIIPGYPQTVNGDSQHLEARPELQDWLQFELLTVKNCRTGPFPKLLGNHFELYGNLQPPKFMGEVSETLSLGGESSPLTFRGYGSEGF